MRVPVGKASAAVRIGDLLRELIGKAERSVSRDRALTHREVHDLRRLLKRSRSLARLLRFGIGEADYRRLNAGLRAVAAPFAPLRDARVLQDALGALSRVPSARISRAALGPLRRRIAARAPSAPDNRPIELKLRRIRRQVERFPVQSIDDRMLDAGLRRVYRRGRRAMGPARLGGDDALHAWRKQVKYLLNQLDCIEQAGGRPSALVRELDRLGERLGVDHDLAMLAQLVAGLDPGTDLSPHARAAILAAVRRRRLRLQARSFELGARLFRRKPDAFLRSLATRKGE